MTERKVHCPETDDDCEDPECSIRICVNYQIRIRKAQRLAEWETNFRQNKYNLEAAAWRAIRDVVEKRATSNTKTFNIIINDGAGNKFKFQLFLPLSKQVRGSKQQKLIAKCLASKNPELVERIGNAMNDMVNEAKEERTRLYLD